MKLPDEQSDNLVDLRGSRTTTPDARMRGYAAGRVKGRDKGDPLGVTPNNDRRQHPENAWSTSDDMGTEIDRATSGTKTPSKIGGPAPDNAWLKRADDQASKAKARYGGSESD